MITGDTTVSIALILCLVNIVLTIWSNFSGSSKDIHEAVLKANMKLDQQCGQLTDMQASIRTVSKEVETIKEEQVRQNMEIKALWRNVDELKEKSQK